MLVDGQRFYRDERVRVHGAISDRLLEGSLPSPEPSALVVAGGPASGKTVLLRTLEVPAAAVHLDADMIKAQLPEYALLLQAAEEQAASLVHEESADVARGVLRRVLAERRNLVLDAVGDSESGKFVAKLDELRAAAYSVSVVYADVDVDIAVRRAAARAAHTGRVVPENELRRLHREVSARFPEVERLDWLTRLRLFATEDGAARLIVERIGKASPIVHDEARLNVFREKALT